VVNGRDNIHAESAGKMLGMLHDATYKQFSHTSDWQKWIRKIAMKLPTVTPQATLSKLVN
jgi:hypothetical protein